MIYMDNIMIVGKKDIVINELIKHTKSIEDLIEYSNSLIPKEFLHLKSIQDNQLYYLLLLLKKSNITYEKKKELSELFVNISPIGYTDTIVPLDILINRVSLSKIRKYYRKEHE